MSKFQLRDVKDLFVFFRESNLYVGDPGRDQVPVSLDMTLPELNCQR